jgi:Uma2 family endonuclease
MAIREPVETAALQERYRFNRQQYHGLVEAGILKEDARVELIRGEVFVMAAINARHASTVDKLTLLLIEGVARRAIVRAQSPFAIGDDSEPQPDLLLLKPRPDWYSSDHPQRSDLLLVVEVADTTLRYDRQVKLPLYAEAGISEVWIVNLVEAVLEIYREPRADGYGTLLRRKAGDTVSPLAFPDLVLPVAELLPSGT